MSIACGLAKETVDLHSCSTMRVRFRSPPPTVQEIVAAVVIRRCIRNRRNGVISVHGSAIVRVESR